MKKIILFLILTQSIISCSNSDDSADDNPISSGNYYAVGSTYGKNKDNNFTQLASVWIDGAPTILSNTAISSVANAVASYNNDIYVAGTESVNNGNTILKVWKNNSGENVTDGNHLVEATDLTVNEGNIYIAGNEFIGPLNSSIATVWKNGQAIRLSDKISEANAVYVLNNDVYVTGYKVINDKKTAIVWKNGVETVLTSEEDDLESIATDIYVNAENIYVIGYLRNSFKSRAILWKNNSPFILSNENDFSQANALFVYNTDVYVVGCDIDTHKYDFVGKVWKNGTLVKEINGANPKSIDIKNNKIYIAGSGLDERGMHDEGKIWESDLNNLNFVAKYKFPNNKVNAILVK
ncbi:hypothetical protein [Flavobacterium hydrophilum]|uniref:Uncharacterized protein n=1 Tax=Flavobacterium hydrophilum TaxID=2211445 RepID=A0A2V4C3W4_9FLAO|nr:hypothetical protein [Flavobacterium hydrophilum]PXY45875.1 hypothetical protein DMB68_01405 [Flavobacterium hydrophilum]